MSPTGPDQDLSDKFKMLPIPVLVCPFTNSNELPFNVDGSTFVSNRIPLAGEELCLVLPS